MTGYVKSSKPQWRNGKMRILINAASAKRGGIVTYTRNLVSFMIDRGIDVTVAAPPDFSCADPSVLLPVRAADLGVLRRLCWEQIWWRRKVQRVAPDILFSSANFGLLYSPVPQVLLMREGGLFDPLYLSHIAPAQGLRVQTTRHFRRQMMLMSARHVQHVITPSVAMRDSLLAWDRSLGNKSSVNHYGARPDLFARGASARSWRKDGMLRLLYVSVYYPHKCPGIVCSVADALNLDGIPTQSTITMTDHDLRMTPGAAQDRAIMKRALDAGRLKMGQYAYDKLPELYESHDVFVFPSVSETFGHPMVEAMASGLPVVAADTAINREICGDGAIYFAPFSVNDLARQIKRLDTDPLLRREIASKAQQRVTTEFRWDSHVDRLLDVFSRVNEEFGRRREQTT